MHAVTFYLQKYGERSVKPADQAGFSANATYRQLLIQQRVLNETRAIINEGLNEHFTRLRIQANFDRLVRTGVLSDYAFTLNGHELEMQIVPAYEIQRIHITAGIQRDTSD